MEIVRGVFASQLSSVETDAPFGSLFSSISISAFFILSATSTASSSPGITFRDSGRYPNRRVSTSTSTPAMRFSISIGVSPSLCAPSMKIFAPAGVETILILAVAFFASSAAGSLSSTSSTTLGSSSAAFTSSFVTSAPTGSALAISSTASVPSWWKPK